MEQWLWGRLWRSLWCSQLSLHPFQRRGTHGVQCGPPCGSLGPEVAKGCVQSHHQRGGQLVSRNWGEKESSSMTLWVRLSLQQLEVHLTNFIGLSACLLPVCFSSFLNLGIEDDTVVAWPAVSGSEPLYVTSHGRDHICLERLSWRSELLPHNLQSICMCCLIFWVESVLCIFCCLARSTAPDVTAVTAGQRLLADESEDESEFTEKDERRDLENLQRIANALVEFYGLGDVIWLRI